ncbi:MAG: hypothetical protein CMN55_08550 [Sneathiella sp.]|uniref:uroporphyrinogen-III synthase n=1 Tax=Sneathiella sp. TaxID=1964365 RepID=UPI000C4044C5|nr:uroporphyrinogen-III synthase [Sneathiella sp.]MAL79146.1 hypothetical protein [Sneathiella sp.]
MKILITRPEPDASALADILSGRGHEPRLAPMMFIENLPNRTLDTAGAQALLITSANGARALGRLAGDKNIRCFAVGRATAEALRAEGYAHVTAAGGDVNSLRDVIIDAATPDGGRLIHVSGSEVAGDLVGMLTEQGFDCERLVLYEALPVTSLDAKITREIKAGSIPAVLFYSPRTAAIFTGIVTAAGLAPFMESMTAYCLSAAIADKISSLRWQEVKIATEPDQEKLLALLPPVGQAGRQDDNPDRSREQEMSDKKSGTTEESGKTAVPAAGTDKQEKAKTTAPGAATAPDPAPKSDPDPKPKPKPAEAPQGETKSRAGLIAAALIVLFFIGLAAWPLLYPVVEPYLPQRTAEIISGRLGQAPAADATGMTDATAAIEAVRENLKADYAALTDRLAALEDQVKSQQSASGAPDGNGANAADTEALKGEIASLSARLEEQQQALAAATEQVKAQQDSIVKLETAEPVAPGPSPEVAGEIVDLKTSLLDLKSELGNLKTELTAERDTVKSQAGQIAALEGALKSEIDSKASRAEESRRTLMLLAVGQLQRETRSSNPFDGSMKQVSAVADGKFADLIGTLQPIAADGAPTVATLRQEFGSIASDITQTARLPSDETWYGKALHRIASAIRFRRVDDNDSADVDAVVARAERNLADSNLAGAVAEVESLQGAAAEVAAPWLEKAKRRLAVEGAITGLLQAVTASAATAPAATPPAAN